MDYRNQFAWMVFLLNGSNVMVSISNNLLADWCTIYVDRYKVIRNSGGKEIIQREGFSFEEQIPSNYKEACEKLQKLCYDKWKIDLDF